MPELSSAPPRILSVSELTRAVRGCLESGIGSVWVEGEISNFRRQASGHQYFTLKDQRSQLPCVLFRDALPASANLALADGMHVQAFGDLTVYEARGQYQLIVELLQTRGVGVLQARFEALKRKLNNEGLFDPARKRPVPAFPLTVGIITSPTGAALQDMLNILRRRAPWLRVLIHPVRVQGQGASVEIVNAIRDFNAWTQVPNRAVDLIVLARGGGSIEDLWEFNEEIVARAIVASRLPIVSAVGHEIDFTIADFAADLRAPTPSAAAELIAPDTAALQQRLGAAHQTFQRGFRDWLATAREQLLAFSALQLGREPGRRLLELRQQLDLAHERLLRPALATIRDSQVALEEKRARLRVAGPWRSLEIRGQTIARWREKLQANAQGQRDRLRARMREAESLLRVLSPNATLERGYTITFDMHGKALRSSHSVGRRERITSRFADGDLPSTVD